MTYLRFAALAAASCITSISALASGAGELELFPPGRLDAIADWRVIIKDGKVHANIGKWPEGWGANVWNGSGSATISIGPAPEADGSKGMSVVNNDPSNAVQVYPGGDITIAQAGTYRMSFLYRAEGSGAGNITVYQREGKVSVVSNSAELALTTTERGFNGSISASAGEWVRVNVVLKTDRPEAKLAVFFRNDANGASNAVWYRDISLMPVSGSNSR